MKRNYLLATCLALISIAAFAAPPAATETIYKCYRDGYDPPVCVPVAHGAGDYDPEAIDIAEVVAASRAAQTGKAQRIMRRLSDGKIAAVGPIVDGCANSHGQSGCCQIIGGYDGIVYIQCG